MAKKTKAVNAFDFTGIIEENATKKTSSHDTQHTHDTQYTHDTQHTQHTQGTQRAQRHPRINMAFYGDNLEFAREAAYQSRMTVTEYVNNLIEREKAARSGKPAADGPNVEQLSLEGVD